MRGHLFALQHLKWLISDQQALKVTTTLSRRRFASVVRFEDARFSSSVCFNEAEFHASVNFDLAAAPVPAVPLYFNGAKFTKSPPYFFGREMHEDTDWTDVELPSAKLQAAQSRWRLRV